MRVDKYLWAIRVFKTRTLATEACKGGKVKLEGQNVKPAHEVKTGEELVIQKGPERRIVRVTGFPESRMDAKKALAYYNDLTPVTEKSSLPTVFTTPVFKRERGTGRPTKRDRRTLDDFRED